MDVLTFHGFPSSDLPKTYNYKTLDGASGRDRGSSKSFRVNLQGTMNVGFTITDRIA